MEAQHLAQSVFKVMHVNHYEYELAITQTIEILKKEQVSKEQLEVLMFKVPSAHKVGDREGYYFPFVNLVNFIRLFTTYEADPKN